MRPMLGFQMVGGSCLALWLLATASAGPPEVNVPGQVDRLLGEEIFQKASSAKMAARSNDQLFLRRISLDLVGQLPTPADVTTFSLDPPPDKRARAVQRLLADTRFGKNQARYWRDVIIYRRSAEQALFFVESIEAYLADEFNRNTSWDKLARAFIAAKGDVRQHGETGVFLAQMGEAVDVAAETSRIFLGIQIQCAQCHDHPTDRWKREQFHEFAAFFPRVALRRSNSAGQPGLELISYNSGPEFKRPGAFGQGALEHFMPDLKNPADRGKRMAPAFFVTNRRLPSGASDDERRQSLADWLTSPDNPWFTKAIVNRLWAELVGEGFYEPVDDIGPDRTCSAPRTLDLLSEQFIAQGYDLKWLLRTIIATDAYQRQSRPKRLPSEPPFTANVPRRLRSDELWDVLSAAAGFDPEGGLRRPPVQQGLGMPQGPRFQFAQIFGFDPSTRPEELASSIPQSLVLMNGPLVSRAVDGRQPATLLGQLLARVPDNEEVTVELYLRSLAREPKPAELKVCLEHVERTGNRTRAFEDIYWSLINSEELLFRN